MLQTAFGRICAIEIDAVQVANWDSNSLEPGEEHANAVYGPGRPSCCFLALPQLHVGLSQAELHP
jgi:hypothetical protein